MTASSRDSELLRRARRGDADAFIRLTEPLRPHVYGVLATMVGRQAAEDLTQEALLRAFRAIGRFRGDAALRTWLTRIAVNLAIRYRRGVRTHESLDDAEASLPAVSSPDTALHVAVREAVQGLTPKLRAAVTLFYFEGLELNDVARVLKINRGTVASRLHEARRILGDRLKLYGEEAEA